MRKEALESLLKYEWSMGNGQCHLCCGTAKNFYPQYDYEDIGHEKSCGIGLAIRELGGSTYFVGELKTDKTDARYLAHKKYIDNMFSGMDLESILKMEITDER